MDKIFRLAKNRTTVKIEALAGLTTFLTMAYIIFVQPAVLSVDFSGKPTGLDFGSLLLATCLSSAAACIFMGLYARYPIALAPGMGENFFFVSVIMSLSALGVNNAWQTALGIVFVSGIVFLLISVLRVREMVINAISQSMRNGIAVGIGLFITFIGLQHGNIVVAKPGSMVGLNTDFISTDIAVFFFGLIVTVVLMGRRIRGAILWGILSAAVAAAFLGKVEFKGLIGLPQVHQNSIMMMDIGSALTLKCLPFIIVFLFMDLFDTMGTIIGVAETAGFMQGGVLPRASRVLVVDSASTVMGACLGTSTVTSYIESATGVAVGGRTGLTSVVTGILFLLALFFSPLIGMISKYSPITAPALIIVGSLMMRNIRKIDWDDYTESIPAFLVMIGIPFCYSIADGLTLGFISYPVIKFFSRRGNEISWLVYAMAVILVLYFTLVRGKLG